MGTWEGSIRFQGYIHALACHSRTFDMDDKIQTCKQLEEKFINGRPIIYLRKLQSFLQTLSTGSLFKKYKRGSGSKRLIWITPHYDYLLWGDELKKEVKGFIPICDLQEINAGFSTKQKNRLFIVSPDRTLELEAKDPQQSKEWMEMIETLIQLNMAELDFKSSLANSDPNFNDKFNQIKKNHIHLLNTGSIFKKWPGQNALGSFTTRLLWTPPTPDRLQWGDVVSKKIMGFVLMDDLVQIKCEGEGNAGKANGAVSAAGGAEGDTKFTVMAMKRSLVRKKKHSH